jgi:hypothetical protein
VKRDPRQTLEEFLQDKGDATRAAYDGVLAAMDATEWRSAPKERYEYAEALVFFGLLERNVETIYDSSGKHIRGSRTWFRLLVP